MRTLNSTKPAGAHWAGLARAAGFTVYVDDLDGVLELTRVFEPGDLDGRAAAETEARDLFRKVPVVSPGTEWGSTADMAGSSALTVGEARFCKSGVSRRFAQGARGVLTAAA